MAFIKYPGGKTSEKKIILDRLPHEIDSYYEPFVGGGAIYFSLNTTNAFINDKSYELIALYEAVQKQNIYFFRTLENINVSWSYVESIIHRHSDFLFETYIRFRDDCINGDELKYLIKGFIVTEIACGYMESIANDFKLDSHNAYDIMSEYFLKKCISMKKLEFNKKHLPEKDVIPNLISGIKAGLYMYIRHIYNAYKLKHKTLINDDIYSATLAALYVFIRETTYSAMFRFNANGEFNVPYGGISYNSKDFGEIISKYKNPIIVDKLNHTVIECMDFERFLKKYKPKKTDFIFVDPPYDSDFNEYAQLSFGKDEHKRLASYLLSQCNANFMLVIKSTDFIASLYKEGILCSNGNSLKVEGFDKKYQVSFMNRNNKETEHLIITNY